MTPEFDRILAHRTRHLVAVVEDLYQAHNGAAVLRACDGLGIQDVHAIENRNPFRIDPEVVAGADRFVTVRRWNTPDLDNTAACLGFLRARGYRIAATSLRPGCIDLAELDPVVPTAVVFGTELAGLSERGHELSDVFVRFPMVGFTQSLNISVTLALMFADLGERLRASDVAWRLSETERRELCTHWSAEA